MSAIDKFAWAALSSRATVQSSYDIARIAIINSVPGDFVECGVFAGSQCAAMARAIMDHRHMAGARKVHLFDSFAGIPAADPEDVDWPHSAGTSACTLKQVQQYMDDWGIDKSLLCYHPGWFENTVHQNIFCFEHIAVLRLDADLYESTKICLKHLYPRLSIGGWLIVDDMNLAGCRKAINEFFADTLPPIYFQVHP